MSIINILKKTGILLICCIIQMLGIIIEGCAKLLDKFVEVLTGWHDKLIVKSEDGKYLKKTSIDVPL